MSLKPFGAMTLSVVAMVPLLTMEVSKAIELDSESADLRPYIPI